MYTKLLKYIKRRKAERDFFPHVALKGRKIKSVPLLCMSGHQEYLRSLKNSRLGERGIIIANGPSLKETPLHRLKNEVTIGCNGIYKLFPDLGFPVAYYMTEDKIQTELRSREIETMSVPLKFAAISNADSFSFHNDINYFQTVSSWTVEDIESQQPVETAFSTNFDQFVVLGGTITYIMLQFAYHLGLNPVYLVGLDHSYGRLSQLYPPGKIEITPENIDIVRECHFSEEYYNIGDRIGVPHVALQEAAYRKARQVYEVAGRKIINVSAESQLEVFQRDDFSKVFGR